MVNQPFVRWCFSYRREVDVFRPPGQSPKSSRRSQGEVSVKNGIFETICRRVNRRGQIRGARVKRAEGSNAGHEAVENALLAGLVEVDGQLVAVDRRDVAVAEFLVEHPVADGKEGGLGRHRLGDEFAVDGARLDRGAAGAEAGIGLAVADALDLVARAGAPVAVGRLGAVLLGALPAGRGVGV